MLLLTILSYAQTRVMTDDERETLKNSATFKQKCQWATRNFAAFWSVDLGASATNENERITWAKNRQLSVEILKNDTKDDDISLRFLNAGKGKQFTLGAAPQPEATLINAWVTTNSFEEFVVEYFKVLGDNINMSIGN